MKEKHIRLIGNLLFPVVLVGLIIWSAWMQTPIISSPEVANDFREKGSEPGYFEDPKPELALWPEHLPGVLKKALISAYGPKMPKAEGFYYFGLARKPWLAGSSLKYGAETVMLANGDRSSGLKLALFGFQIKLMMTGQKQGRAWRFIGGSPAPARENAAQAALWLERAALLLPLAQLELSWTEGQAGTIWAEIQGLGRLELDFGGNNLTSAKLAGFELRPIETIGFGTYNLPSKWLGRWGQEEVTRFDLMGLVFNPPFGSEAVKPPQVEK